MTAARGRECNDFVREGVNFELEVSGCPLGAEKKFPFEKQGTKEHIKPENF
jgi:hypothetical protein